MSTAASAARIRRLAGQLGRPVRIMEVCGTHTVTACRAGLRALLPASVRLNVLPEGSGPIEREFMWKDVVIEGDA